MGRGAFSTVATREKSRRLAAVCVSGSQWAVHMSEENTVNVLQVGEEPGTKSEVGLI